MAKEYLEQLSAILVRTTSDNFNRVSLECKHFFSGAAVYANGKICMSLTPVGFALKLPEKYRSTLMEQEGVKPLRYFPRGPIKKDYVVLPDVILSDARALRRWVRVSIEYVTLSPGAGKRKPRG